MGDAPTRDFPVYLPPNYDSTAREPYPLIFFLAGWGGKSSAYVADDSAFGVSLPKRLDRAVSAGRLDPFIGIFPDCSSKLGGSQYLNSPSFGNYSDYIADELVSWAEANFNCGGNPQNRGLIGHSSGGFGAIVTAMKRPDRFLNFCSSAADSLFEMSLLPLVNNCLIEIEKAGSIVRFLDEYLNHPSPKNLSRSKGEALMLLSMAPCYAPSPKEGPLYGKLFFDLSTGEIIESTWKEYLSWDPIRLVDTHQGVLQKMISIHLCAGSQDEYCLQFGQRQISKKFKEYKIKHHFEEYSGSHSGHSWRFESHVARMTQTMKNFA